MSGQHSWMRFAPAIRRAYVREHEDGTVGIHGDSSDDEILTLEHTDLLSMSASDMTR